MVGDETGIRELVVFFVLLEPNRESLHGLSHVSRHEGDDQARVEPAAEHRAERHVAHQAATDGALERLDEPLRPFRERAAFGNGLRVGPVRMRADGAVFDHEHMTGHQLEHRGERRPRARDVSEGQIELNCDGVDVHRNASAREDGF